VGRRERRHGADRDHRLRAGLARRHRVRADVGLEIVAGASCAEVESTKSVSEIYSPVSGTVSAVNEALADEPERINRDPYGDGWIFTLTMIDASELDALMDAAAYQHMVEEA